MTTTDNKDIVRRFVEAAQTKHDLSAIDAMMSPDFVDHSVPPGLPPDREGVKMQFTLFFAALPDLHAVIHEQIAEGDKVMTRKSLRGTHQGELFGVPPTGKPLSIEVIDILRVRDGKITDHWNLVDQLGLMRQLGAVPA
jgi:steroid delta-isomerase-like uncharacterized protein